MPTDLIQNASNVMLPPGDICVLCGRKSPDASLCSDKQTRQGRHASPADQNTAEEDVCRDAQSERPRPVVPAANAMMDEGARKQRRALTDHTNCRVGALQLQAMARKERTWRAALQEQTDPGRKKCRHSAAVP